MHLYIIRNNIKCTQILNRYLHFLIIKYLEIYYAKIILYNKHFRSLDEYVILINGSELNHIFIRYEISLRYVIQNMKMHRFQPSFVDDDLLPTTQSHK